MRWASNLAATPLQSLCEATLLELWNDLDRFAARPDDLDSLGAFLALELRGGIRPGFEQFARIVEWAAAMPLVTNEDWRHTAFTRILKATEGLGAECRDAVQKLTLGRAFDALKGYKFGLENLVSGLVFLPLTIETAEWTIAAWLDCARNTARADLDSLVDLLVRNLEYKADAANTPAVEAFLRHLDQVPGYPSALKRQAAARAACECSDARLQGRLAEFLLRDYEINGLSGLEQWDLAFLANMPFEWWVEQSTRIELGRVSPSVLLNWMERVIRKSPDSAWWATVLACEWLSRSDPNGIADFWFDLCTLPSLPLDNRKLLFEALKVFRPEEKNP